MKLFLYNENHYYSFVKYKSSLTWVLTHQHYKIMEPIMWDYSHPHEEDINEVIDAFREQYNITLDKTFIGNGNYGIILTIKFKDEADEAEFILKIS